LSEFCNDKSALASWLLEDKQKEIGGIIKSILGVEDKLIPINPKVIEVAGALM
jgi:hypothetical protein